LDLLRQDPDSTGALVDQYRRPVPLLAAGQVLAREANATMDVSDGLLIDLQRLAEASGCAAEVDLDALPLSRAFIAERGQDRRARLFAATGGDDYALLAALPEDFDPLGLPLPSDSTIAAVGRLAEGSGITLRDAAGPVGLPERMGYEHRRD
jgi:thiamine-monophosphate kinase